MQKQELPLTTIIINELATYLDFRKEVRHRTQCGERLAAFSYHLEVCREASAQTGIAGKVGRYEQQQQAPGNPGGCSVGSGKRGVGCGSGSDIEPQGREIRCGAISVRAEAPGNRRNGKAARAGERKRRSERCAGAGGKSDSRGLRGKSGEAVGVCFGG